MPASAKSVPTPPPVLQGIADTRIEGPVWILQTPLFSRQQATKTSRYHTRHHGHGTVPATRTPPTAAAPRGSTLKAAQRGRPKTVPSNPLRYSPML